MTALWPHWQRPLFIILIPIVVYLLWKLWQLNIHKGSWQDIIPKIFQPFLLRGVQGKNSSTPKWLITLASVFAAIALLGPSWKHIEQPPLKLDAPLVIVLDLTPRMLSNDLPPNRLENVKRKLLDIISVRKDAQTAIIAYAGSAHVVAPLSDEKEALENLIKVLSPNIMPKGGENAEQGITKAITLIDNARQNSKNQKAEILLVTTGLNTSEEDSIKKQLAGKSIQLDILGVGTSQGAPILVNGEFLKDASGRIISTKLNSNNLEKLAYSEGGYYSTISFNNTDIEALHLSNPTGDKRLINEKDMRTTSLWQDQGYWFILPLLFIALFAGRKGWLFCIPVVALGFQPQTVHAFEWNQLWLNKDQQGQKLLQENKPEEAAKTFQNKQWQSYAAYEAKDYKSAEKTFANAETPEGTYNYGNALARQGKYKEAITAWDKAIKDKPNFEQAIVNKKIVEDLLKQQEQEQQQQQNNEQNTQQNQDDNQQSQENQQNQQQSNESSGSPQNNEQSQNNQQQQGDNPQNDQQQSRNENQQQNSSQNKSDSQNNSQNQNNTQSEDQPEENSNNLSSAQSAQVPEQQQQEQGKNQQPNAVAPTDQQDDQSSNNQQDAVTEDIPIEQQEKEENLRQRLPESEDLSELLRNKFYFEQRYNKR